MAQTTCATSCIDIAIAESGCQSAENLYCLCMNKPYINNFENCAKTYCTPADYQLLIQWGEGECASIGISLTVSADAPASAIVSVATVTTIGPPSSPTAAITSAPSPQSPSSTTSSNSGGGDPLSLPAEIATIVGTVVAVIALIATIIFGWNQCVKNRNTRKVDNNEAQQPLVYPPGHYNM